MNALKLDLHIHSIYSGDSLIKPRDLLIYSKKIGLDGFAITDHDSMKAYKVLKKYPESKDLLIIPGMEIETDIGEVLALFIDNEIDCKDNEFFTIVQKIKENNGLVVIPHPFDFLRDNHLKTKLLTKNIIDKYIDGVEIMNSRTIFKFCIKKAEKFKNKYNLFETGGSDAHTLKEIGNGYTFIPTNLKITPENIKNELLSKNAKSQGHLSSPFVHFLTIINKIKKDLSF
jgi:hypothetical protein